MTSVHFVHMGTHEHKDRHIHTVGEGERETSDYKIIEAAKSSNLHFSKAGASGEQWCSSSDIPQLEMQDINNQLKAARQEEFIGVQ